MGAFSDAAYNYCDLGLAPTPTGGKDGKHPMLVGYNRHPLNLGNVSTIIEKFGDANVALLTGASNLNVLDIDDPSLLQTMRKRFGDTPLVVRTAGRGGYQLYYRSSPHVQPSDLRLTEGIPVEIKARGNIVIAPPSRNPMTGREYEIVEGCFDAFTLAALPKLIVPAIHRTKTGAEHRKIAEGHRNGWLFSVCLREARNVDDLDALIDVGRTRNDECEPPLADAEVLGTCKSAWNYTIANRNFASSGGNVVVSRGRVETLCRVDPGNPIALALKLELEHAERVRRGETFALASRSMVDADTLPGWTRANIRTATNKALLFGLIECVERDRGRARYTLPGLKLSGLISRPNETNTPPPPSPRPQITAQHETFCRRPRAEPSK